MRGRSSQQQLLVMLNEIFSNKNSKTCSDIVYLDISKAFDSVSHDILFLKLQLMGISGTILNWFKAYLDNRRQLVSVNGSFSGFLPVTSGVPQGSILGPLLFLIYINDLPDSVLFSKPLLFADDTKCLISSTKDVSSHNMQQDLDSLYQWSISNYMNFNQSKCAALRIPSIGLPPVYLLNGYSIPITNLFKDLGVLLSGDLSWSAHINMIVTRAYKMLGLIRRCFSHTASVPVRRLLYTSLVRSHLIYCSVIWRPYLRRDIIVLEKLQRRATKFILNDYTSDYKTRLSSLELLPLSMTLELYDIIFFLKSVRSPSPSFDTLDYIHFSVSSGTRSSSNNKLLHLLASTTSSSNFYFNRLPRLWNSLPSIDDDVSTSAAISRLKALFWSHFLLNFNNDDPCSYHFLCPCPSCAHSSPNFTYL